MYEGGIATRGEDSRRERHEELEHVESVRGRHPATVRDPSHSRWGLDGVA
jgi:hypothetical protein